MTRLYLPGLRDAMTERGLTFAQVGRELDIPWQTIANICRETDRRRTTVEIAERLADLLNVSLERLKTPPPKTEAPFQLVSWLDIERAESRKRRAEGRTRGDGFYRRPQSAGRGFRE